MKLVFIDQLGCHAALLAAYYQTGNIGGQPSRQEILRLPAFADQQDICPGDLRELGTDASGNLVYTLGVGGEGKIMMVSALDLLGTLGVKQDIRIIDVSTYNSYSQKICWYLALLPGLKPFSRQLSATLLQKRWPQLAAFLAAELTNMGLENSHKLPY